MPIYEYFCSECNLRFEMLRPLSEANQMTACSYCHNPVERIPSSFSRHKAKTYLDKLNERKAEVEYKADRRIEADPLMQPDRWLEKVKQEREEEKRYKKEVERTFGKEPDAALKYEAAVENVFRCRREGPWAAD